MKIKVCGMREKENLKELSQLPIDYVGFIFYDRSKRFVEQKIEEVNFQAKKKVGVFVNELLNVVMEKVVTHDLQVVQLHGTESPEYCGELKRFLELVKPPNPEYSGELPSNLSAGNENRLEGKFDSKSDGVPPEYSGLGGFTPQIIKAFSVDENFDFSQTKNYEPCCDYFLFDTKGKLPGGNGYTFDWTLLENYQGSKPFFLSGGIDPTHVEVIKSLNIKQLYAIDINSGFEIEPALKDISLLKKFIEDVRN